MGTAQRQLRSGGEHADLLLPTLGQRLAAAFHPVGRRACELRRTAKFETCLGYPIGFSRCRLFSSRRNGSGGWCQHCLAIRVDDCRRANRRASRRGARQSLGAHAHA